MPDNPHFEFPSSLAEAKKLVTFDPLTPKMTELTMNSIAVFVRDHKQRDLSLDERSLELHYDGFVFSQTRKGAAEARRMTREVSFGPAPQEALIAGREGRLYPLGPESDDIDPRNPATVVWHDGDMFYLIASDSRDAYALLQIAQSAY